MNERHEMASPGWLTILQQSIEAAIAGAGDDARLHSFALSERYSGVPEHLAGPSGILGWCARVTAGSLAFEHEPDPNADVFIDADYATVVPIARIAVDGDPDRRRELNRAQRTAIEAGTLTVTGDFQRIPAYFSSVHDAVAHHTA
jgi:hypothetical protein